MFDKNKFGKQIKLFRKKRGFTQEVLSEKADISYSYLLSIEAGRNNPTVDVIVSLLNALNVNYNELMNEKEYNQSLNNIIFEKLNQLENDEAKFMSFILLKL